MRDKVPSYTCGIGTLYIAAIAAHKLGAHKSLELHVSDRRAVADYRELSARFVYRDAAFTPDDLFICAAALDDIAQAFSVKAGKLLHRRSLRLLSSEQSQSSLSLKLILANAAERTDEILGNVLPLGACFDTCIGAALRLVIDKSAYCAYILHSIHSSCDMI